MKKKLMVAIAVVAIAAMTAFNLNISVEKNTLSSISLDNIEALATGESEPDCRSKGGYWNMALTCADGGIETTQCRIEGELSILGVTLKGGYTKGQSYTIAWERWTCINSTENCCESSKQGVRVVE